MDFESSDSSVELIDARRDAMAQMNDQLIAHTLKLMHTAVSLGIDYVKVGNIEIKTRPAPTALPAELTQQQVAQMDEELLYHSS